jgi:hypothetical protein
MAKKIVILKAYRIILYMPATLLFSFDFAMLRHFASQLNLRHLRTSLFNAATLFYRLPLATEV